jgi:hypothetical protein
MRLRNGRTADFTGYLASVRTTGGDTTQVDNEGTAQEDRQTGRRVTRPPIGAGAGSGVVQGRDDLI